MYIHYSLYFYKLSKFSVKQYINKKLQNMHYTILKIIISYKLVIIVIINIILLLNLINYYT